MRKLLQFFDSIDKDKYMHFALIVAFMRVGQLFAPVWAVAFAAAFLILAKEYLFDASGEGTPELADIAAGVFGLVIGVL